MLLNLEGVIIKDYFSTLNDNFLLDLECNVSEFLSIRSGIACFPNSWGILLYRLMTSNVAMGELGSIFSGMEFKESVVLNIT